ncbi:MAG: translesion error-prone DNA polymerase V autoproteolytic subunit [Burkholderiales bacterium]|nr:translesion error-prone DNA polymerase V autoproteolytic subunit [Nitrosomonas sp.]MCP5245891.1 translesion error-prone DNA polymerase V autoproteolytic subunit [Burkholderiales bacterium]MCP5276712.1 translesion error-prone DNA polymerase V autoproteolytic subunit [Burkholderiales bacterium]MCP5303616.1 translesion error-prone DNA polymerase V autoproteolytic subunit [Pseudomonadales bacterium]
MNKKQHGGKREGAGRKKRFDGPVTRIRVPQSCVPMVNQMLEQLIDDPGANTFKGILYPANEPTPLRRPIFSSSVPAGFPSPADDYIEGRLDLNEYFVPRPSSTFYVRVTGESMIGAGILPDDILIVDRSLDAVHDSIVIAVVNNELTVKRLYKRNGRIELRPDNPAYPIIQLDKEMELIIWGVVSGVTRKL